MNPIPLRRPSTRILRQAAIHFRTLHTDPYVIYRNPRRLRAAGMTIVAAGQASFWAGATSLAQQVPDPLLSPAWSVAGFGLSAAFIAMVGVYLRRNVAEIALVNGPSLRITAHSLGGLLRTPVLVSADDLVPGPKKDHQSERYWTIGARRSPGRTYYFIVDTKNGVMDRDGLAAAARGGDHLLVFSHKRDAEVMQGRWQQWERTKHSKHPSRTADQPEKLG